MSFKVVNDGAQQSEKRLDAGAPSSQEHSAWAGAAASAYAPRDVRQVLFDTSAGDINKDFPTKPKTPGQPGSSLDLPGGIPVLRIDGDLGDGGTWVPRRPGAE